MFIGHIRQCVRYISKLTSQKYGVCLFPPFSSIFLEKIVPINEFILVIRVMFVQSVALLSRHGRLSNITSNARVFTRIEPSPFNAYSAVENNITNRPFGSIPPPFWRTFTSPISDYFTSALHVRKLFRIKWPFMHTVTRSIRKSKIPRKNIWQSFLYCTKRPF